MANQTDIELAEEVTELTTRLRMGFYDALREQAPEARDALAEQPGNHLPALIEALLNTVAKELVHE